MKKALIKRIEEYLSGGGLFNPEMANHIAVRDLLIECRIALAQPEQEPVAWLDEYGNAFPLAAKQYSVVGKHWKPLYTTPPQRTWVGLTDQQIEGLFPEKQSDDGLAAYWLSFAQSIEAKLKEKNSA